MPGAPANRRRYAKLARSHVRAFAAETPRVVPVPALGKRELPAAASASTCAAWLPAALNRSGMNSAGAQFIPERNSRASSISAVLLRTPRALPAHKDRAGSAGAPHPAGSLRATRCARIAIIEPPLLLPESPLYLRNTFETRQSYTLYVSLLTPPPAAGPTYKGRAHSIAATGLGLRLERSLSRSFHEPIKKK